MCRKSALLKGFRDFREITAIRARHAPKPSALPLGHTPIKIFNCGQNCGQLSFFTFDPPENGRKNEKINENTTFLGDCGTVVICSQSKRATNCATPRNIFNCPTHPSNYTTKILSCQYKTPTFAKIFQTAAIRYRNNSNNTDRKSSQNFIVISNTTCYNIYVQKNKIK